MTLQIIQDDRERAAQITWLNGVKNRVVEKYKSGDLDKSPLVQQLAEHRIAALSASPAPSGQGVSGEVERLREALKPFLHVAEPIVHNDKGRWNPDEWFDRLKRLTVGQFRALHAAALSPQGLDAK